MNKRIVFFVIIVVFVGSILLGFSSLMFMPQGDQNDVYNTTESQDTSSDDEIIGQSISGVVRPLEASIYMQGDHYLEVNGVILALLKSTHGINLDKYNNKNVEIWGEPEINVEGDGYIIDVEKIKIE